MWLLGSTQKFLSQILYACLADFSPLTRCFFLKLLYIYEIGITPNFKFEFCNYTSLFAISTEQLLPNFLKKKLEVELGKIDTYTIRDVIDKIDYTTPLGKSDHTCIEFGFLTNYRDLSSSYPKLDYWKADYRYLKRDLADRLGHWIQQLKYHWIMGGFSKENILTLW